MTTASITTPAPASALELLSEHACFGGAQRFYRHASSAIGLPMRFSVYLPPQALAGERCAALVYLAGLTCTEETFAIKAGAQRVAAREGLILIAPDTSPRGAGVPGETDNWDFGVGAGFYLDATQAPWRTHYRMESYVADELIDTVVAALPVDARRIGIFGHSMGGHGALTLALRHPARFRSVSAFAPIAHPSICPWGIKAFTGYLGDDRTAWAAHDATLLMRQARGPFPGGILIDQGEADPFLAEQLYPDAFADACRGRRPTAAAAPASRLRPRVLLHRQLHRGPPAAPRGTTALRRLAADGTALSGCPNRRRWSHRCPGRRPCHRRVRRPVHRPAHRPGHPPEPRPFRCPARRRSRPGCSRDRPPRTGRAACPDRWCR